MSSSPPTHDDWARAYARQAQADFLAWNHLSVADLPLPESQRLHFLQMACEKLGKAHAYKSGVIPKNIQTSHVFISKQISVIVRAFFVEFGKKAPKKYHSTITQCRHVAREIEVLHPSVDDGGQRPENCEYPWVDSGNKLRVPRDWNFLPSRLLNAPQGRFFLKIIGFSIDDLLAAR